MQILAGLAFFAAFIAAHFLFGIAAAVKVLGVTCIATGALWFIGRSVPVDVEARPPSFFLRGWVAIFAGLAMASLGIGLVLYSHQSACVLGWAIAAECS
jgi:hypothetical protein